MAFNEILAAEWLEGEKVVNGKGEEIGTVEDVLIDALRGRAAYAVISRDELAGRRVAVPWDALRRDSGRRVFILVDGEPGA